VLDTTLPGTDLSICWTIFRMSEVSPLTYSVFHTVKAMHAKYDARYRLPILRSPVPFSEAVQLCSPMTQKGSLIGLYPPGAVSLNGREKEKRKKGQ